MGASHFRYECQQAAFRLALKRDLRQRGVTVAAAARYDTETLVVLHGAVTPEHISRAASQYDRNLANRKAA